MSTKQTTKPRFSAWRAFAGAAAMMAGVLGAGSAHAADEDAPSTAEILQPQQLVRIADLAFGSVVPGATGGQVIVNEATNVRTTNGTVIGYSGTHHRAQFRATGSAGIVAIVTLPVATTVTRQGGSETMLVNNYRLQGAAINLLGVVTINLGPTGVRDLNIGATLNVGPNQEPGDYEGTFQVSTIYL